MKKTIIARLSVQDEYNKVFLAAAEKMIQDSNNEEGCLSYRLFNAIDLSTDYIFHEEYKNREAVDTHNSSEHFKTFISLIGSMLSEEPIIEVFWTQCINTVSFSSQ